MADAMAHVISFGAAPTSERIRKRAILVYIKAQGWYVGVTAL